MSYNLFLLHLLEFQIITDFLKSEKHEYGGHKACVNTEKQAKSNFFFLMGIFFG